MITTMVILVKTIVMMMMAMVTWLVAGPPTVVQALPRATKGKRMSRGRGRPIMGMQRRRGGSLVKHRRFNERPVGQARSFFFGKPN